MKKLFISFLLIFVCSASFAYSSLAKSKVQKYSDIPIDHPLFESIDRISDMGAIEGYSDGSFRPEGKINRAELLKMVMRSKGSHEGLFEYDSCFDDVPKGEWYSFVVCHAKNHQIVHGYPGTNLFKPANTINSAEALKIIFEAFDVTYDAGTSPWYMGMIDHAANEYNVSLVAGNEITRGEVAEILYRVVKETGIYVSYGFEEYDDDNDEKVDSDEKNKTEDPIPEKIDNSAMVNGLDCNRSRTFNMIVLFDDNSYTATDEEIMDMMKLSSDHLFARTCTGINVLEILRVKVDGTISDGNLTSNIDDVLPFELAKHKDLVAKANGFTFFTEMLDCSHYNGGCTAEIVPKFQLDMPEYCNDIPTLSSTIDYVYLYGSIVDWDHKYGACGYDFDNYLKEQKVRDHSDIQCIDHNGFSMCPLVVNEYYASDPRLMVASTIVHEIMHFFGDRGNYDHRMGDEICLDRYKGTLDGVSCTRSDGTEYDDGDCFFNICKYTYENFMDANATCN